MTHAQVRGIGRARVVPLALAASVFVGLTACSTDPNEAVDATVSTVIDSGTVEVSREGGDKQVIVLAGIEVPQNGADLARSCVSGESLEFIRTKVPSGSAVRLAFGSDGADSAEPATGTVLLGDGLSLNETLVREGLAIPASDGSRDGSAVDFAAAQEIARSAQAGFFSKEIPCTVPGQVAALRADVNCATVQAEVEQTTTASTGQSSVSTTATTGPSSTKSAALTETVAASGSAEIAPQIKAAVTLLDKATDLQAAIERDADTIVWRALNEAQRLSCSKIIDDTVVFATRDHESLVVALAMTQQREAEAARVAEEQRVSAAAEAARVAEEQRVAAAAEAARVVAEQQAAAEAEAARVASAQQAEAQRQAAAAAAARQSSSNPSGGSGGSPSSGNPGSPSTYTGPRCYAPGGKTWKPC